MKNFFFVIYLLISTFLTGQNCYKVVADLTGFPTSEYESILEPLACSLINEMPTEFQNQFKVYHFGFYSQNEFMQGGFQAAWQIAINDAKSTTPYYLLFGRQNEDSKGNSRIWVEISLPSTGNFSCLSDVISTIKYRVENAVNTYYNSHKSPFEYSNAEKEGIVKLQSIVVDIKNCCQPGNRNICSQCEAESISDYMVASGFDEFSINLEQPVFGQNLTFQNSVVNDISNRRVLVGGNSILLGEYLNSFVNELNANVDLGLIVTSNLNFCQLHTRELEALSNHKYNIWFHLDENENNYSISKEKIKIISQDDTAFDQGINFALTSFVYQKLNLTGITFSTENDLSSEISDFFANVYGGIDPVTPQNIADNLWNYQPKIDMSKAPESSPKNSLGVQRNGRWFFKERLTMQDKSMWSQENIIRIQNNEAPRVDQTWLLKNPNHIEFEFKKDASGNILYENGQPVRQKLIHHHIDHGKKCVAIPEGAHTQYSKYIHYLTKNEKNFTKAQKLAAIRQKISNLNQGMALCGLFLNVTGFLTGDPGNIINWFGPAKINQLKYDPESKFYTLFYNEAIFEKAPKSGFHKGWKRFAWFKAFVDYAWDEEINKFVGIGIGFEGYVFTTEDKKTKLVITDCFIEDHQDCIEFNKTRG
ncbi:MAG: hypothetical protein IPN73_20190 [Saprospiraceae bacterium]|nr:hypothetical protein [Saprospiraceae bacterium]